MHQSIGNPEDAKPNFKVAKVIFDLINGTKILNAEMRYLSMIMSIRYKIAIEEGANIVRTGTILFGNRIP